MKTDKEIRSLEAYKWYFGTKLSGEGYKPTEKDDILYDLISALDKLIQQERNYRDELQRVVSSNSYQQSAFGGVS